MTLRISSSVFAMWFVAACAPRSSAPLDLGPSVREELSPSLVGALPFDPGVRSGQLDNGLRYFIETNDKPKDRAVFRLVVEAGSVLEDPDQLGVAHFVEHMAFNGTAHFEGNELIKYLESTGTQFGAHLNAHTSFDETVYKLQVPTDDPEVFDKAFLILEDWASGLMFDSDEVEAERGVVLEEWRSGLGPYERSWKATMPAVYYGSPYADRLPIGTEESLKTFTRDAAVRFYRDWYRPDLMSVVVVGSVDPDDVEARIRKHFGSIPMAPSPRPRVHPPIEDHEEILTVVYSDPEFTRTRLTLQATEDFVLSGTHEEYREGFVVGTFFLALSERLDAIAHDPGAAFYRAGAGRSRLTPTEGAWTLSITPKEGQILEAYEAVLVEVERMRRFGITSGELERAVANQLRGMESYWEERHTTPSRVHAEELVRHVTTGESVPGIEYEWMLAREMLPTIGVDEVSEVARAFPRGSRVLTLLMPEREGEERPTEVQFLEVQERVAGAELTAPEDSSSVEPLLADELVPGEIVDERTDEALGFQVWTLSNGAEVWVRATDYESEEILFRGRSIGGHNQVSEALYPSAAVADELRAASGLGDLDVVALGKRLAGTSASARSWIGPTHEGVSGVSTPDDLEVLLQQVYLMFTSPRFDSDAFELSQAARAERIRNRDANPATAFHDRWTEAMWGGFPRYMPWTQETLAQVDLDEARAFYTDRFADASDFRFVFVGNVQLQELRALVERYLASLPSIPREHADDRVDLHARRVDGVVEETVYSGTDPKAMVQVLFHGPFESTFLSRNRLQALSSVLGVRLREVLREDRGGVYGVRVGGDSVVWPEGEYTFAVSFVCDPDRVRELEEAMFEVLREAKTTPLPESYLEEHRQKSHRSREEALRTNSFWAQLVDGTMEVTELTGESLRDVLDYERRVDSLTSEEVRAMAEQVFDFDRYVHMRHMPEDLASSGAEEAP